MGLNWRMPFNTDCPSWWYQWDHESRLSKNWH